jgi:DNA integrity scanning protein DisA with diadenylate cyclase activity
LVFGVDWRLQHHGDIMGKGEQSIIQQVCQNCICVNTDTLEKVITLAVEIAREGREGKKIGAMFVVSDTDAVLGMSRCLILDPIALHPESKRRLVDSDLRETVKELAQLDGAFIVSDDGILISASRHINASSQGVRLPLGLGSRHMAAASITKRTNAVAVVVSQGSMVRVFDQGEIVAEILPELWPINRHGLHVEEPFATHKAEQMIAVRKTS